MTTVGTSARAFLAGPSSLALDGGVIYCRRGPPPPPDHPIYYNNIILYSVHGGVTYITMFSCERVSARVYILLSIK